MNKRKFPWDEYVDDGWAKETEIDAVEVRPVERMMKVWEVVE